MDIVKTAPGARQSTPGQREAGMAQQETEKKRLAVGLLAHVDAGKTTLSEALLYESGAVRRLGRVDPATRF